MAYDEFLADRIRLQLKEKHISFEEKKMMGGLCFMVNNKMCIGVDKDRLMVRTNPNDFEVHIKTKGCIPMDFTGKIMKSFVFVMPEGIDADKDLSIWLDIAITYNPIAKLSKKKKK